MDTQKIVTRSGLELMVEQQPGERQTHLLLRLNTTTPCILHWGLRKPRDSQWHLPPPELWPEGTTPHAQAAQSPFAPQNPGDHALLRLSAPDTFSALEFALFLPDQKKWDNNAGRNYQIALPYSAPQLPAVGPALQEQVGQTPLAFKQTFQFRGGGELAVAVRHQQKHYHVWMLSDIPDLVLHWGVAQNSTDEWLSPPHAIQPPGTTLAQNSANTAFAARAGLCALELDFSEADAPLAINFVLKNGSGQWFHNQHGGNFQLPIASRTPVAGPAGSGELAPIAKQIIGVEIGPQGWTLMHRFNLCHDLLSRVGGNPEGLGLLFVWLRYSALRQLTWQRNYNTKPRELSHAEDRLTLRIAEVYREQPEARPLVRLMLTTVGRGGEGQKVRDEILQIMHRHHIKEISGHFMEEWHQKLHNNTTPDDIVICEAYLAFLNHNGSRERFYETLRAGGVTRERLQSFERPIRSDPDFHPHIKDALVHDFENFLKILKSVHAGTDLETALNVAQGQLDGATRDLCYQVWNRRNDSGLSLRDRVALITRARRALSGLLQSHHQVRDLLYLDLALEQYLRGTIEQNIHLQLSGDDLVELISRVLENLNLSLQDPELVVCALHWGRLKDQPRFNQDWALHAKSVLDRVARALSRWIDSIYKLLQPQAELLGRGFKADEWTITLFSEEVVRGNSLGFVCSMLLHHLDPLLRKAARLGDWQIVSRGKGRGLVEVVADLRSVQGKEFDAPRVVIADRVSGDEELPATVKAVIAPDVTDIVSHVAVRARNANLLFASCFDPALLEKLKSFRGKEVELEVTPAGDVLFNEATGSQAATAQRARAALPRVTRPQFTGWALPLPEFKEQLVGQKSLNQLRLREKLPDWIRQPKSIALPFGVCEKVLGMEQNATVAQQLSMLVPQIPSDPTDVLGEIRQAILNLSAPEELPRHLRETATRAGLSFPQDWDTAWSRIKQVWASKWNERAYFSRRTVGMPDDDLFMAVLIQEVVEASYAFVIHTVNPMTGRTNELFAEVVLGLGETLVGNYPGRALAFVYDKGTRQYTLLSYPGKSAALYGSGLIFRSDSNGEDLAGYAGAGLYESVLLQPPREVLLDYANERLVWDAGFRRELLDSVARVGVEIERLLGSPQDIEGAISAGQSYVVQTRPQAGAD